MTLRLGLLLSALVVLTAAMTPLLGVPVYGRNFAHDANFALTALSFMDAGISEGRWWPRWVMETNFGLGGITFFTYPPMGYWIAALVRRATGLNIADTLAVTMTLWRLVFLGGCFLWLRRHVPPAAALAAAALAALLPYPALVNPWIRFSYAEVAGAAMLPFLLLAIERAAESRDGRGIPGLALVFGALAMTHLPSCALVAHLAPIYGWAYGGPRGALRTLAGGIGGAGLAACFILPAAALLKDANFEGLDGGIWQNSLMFYGGLNGTAVWVQFLLVVWTTGWAAVLMALTFRWLARAMPQSPLRRAAMVLLFSSFALMTVVTLPLWIVLPQLRSIEFPWRATGVLTMPVAALAALALAGGARMTRPAVLLLGLGSAALPPLFVWVMTAFGNPEWPRFLPPEQRLERALVSPRGTSPEHLPVWALHAGWDSLWRGTETEKGPEPFPRPPLPAGTQRIPGGFVLPEATTTFSLPQFYFPAWQATDGSGHALQVRPGPDGLVQVVVDRPVRNLRVAIGLTQWEWGGWAVTGLTAASLLCLAFWRRRPVATPAVAQVVPRVGSR
ncbi:hypothetical protein ACFQY5_10755 [Paeniroseomonas aquatica]|uniref:Membrane protein 6-pyruvoyl-tetrahydropterin synthase-related domain-containing protein n=1 Tax=Paeniroseomonas aquatica TaxID=373043 RepID=A0ABT8A8T8_9PROT|nr:hypothetical protein [Paeniroseomonas aquatica]MDN3565831.1 hypothetical protein [Paeniroseomonas aquatica]